MRAICIIFACCVPVSFLQVPEIRIGCTLHLQGFSKREPNAPTVAWVVHWIRGCMTNRSWTYLRCQVYVALVEHITKNIKLLLTIKFQWNFTVVLLTRPHEHICLIISMWSFFIAISLSIKTWWMMAFSCGFSSPVPNGSKHEIIFASTSSTVEVEGDTLRGWMIAFRLAVLGLGRAMDWCAILATQAPPSCSITITLIISSSVYPCGQYNFNATLSYSAISPHIPAWFFKPDFTSVATQSTFPLATAKIHCLWSSNATTLPTNLQLSFTFVRHKAHTWSTLHCSRFVSPPIGWYAKGIFSPIPCSMQSTMPWYMTWDLSPLQAAQAFPTSTNVFLQSFACTKNLSSQDW